MTADYTHSMLVWAAEIYEAANAVNAAKREAEEVEKALVQLSVIKKPELQIPTASLDMVTADLTAALRPLLEKLRAKIYSFAVLDEKEVQWKELDECEAHDGRACLPSGWYASVNDAQRVRTSLRKIITRIDELQSNA